MTHPTLSVSDVTNLTITDLSEVTTGVCQGSMDKHGFVIVGEEKFFLGLDVLNACGFLADRFADGREITFASIPAQPSRKIAVVIAIDGQAGKADDEQLLKALESKPQQKNRSGARKKGSGKPVVRGKRPQQPVTFYLGQHDTFGAVAETVNWEKNHVFVRGTMVFVKGEVRDDDGYFPLQTHEHIRFGDTKCESKNQLFIHVSKIPADDELLAAIEAGETIAVRVVKDKQGRLAGKVIGLLGTPVEEVSDDDTVVELPRAAEG